uniref:JmjC domain-containing protein n=1 Tax=Timema shepardi TaxID=629360 RepID=A0A7R9B205_TIMSH|nr:unnamed protein product [Timema shepardi]
MAVQRTLAELNNCLPRDITGSLSPQVYPGFTYLLKQAEEALYPGRYVPTGPTSRCGLFVQPLASPLLVERSEPTIYVTQLVAGLTNALVVLSSTAEDGEIEVRISVGDSCLALERAQMVLDATWETLNTGHWKEVALYQRQVYTAAGLIKIMALLQVHQNDVSQSKRSYLSVLKESLETADMSLLLGAPLAVLDGKSMIKAAQILSSALSTLSSNRTNDNRAADLQVSVIKTAQILSSALSTLSSDRTSDNCAAQILSSALSTLSSDRTSDNCAADLQTVESDSPSVKPLSGAVTLETTATGSGSEHARITAEARELSSSSRREPRGSAPQVPGVKGEAVPSAEKPSLERFRADYFSKRLPVKLTECIVFFSGCMDHWPALSRWQDLNYIKMAAGPRTVPIELGDHYVSPDWSQKLMTVSEFVDKHVLKEGGGLEVGYLAQHQLFDQVPELKADIREPDYCCISDDLDDDGEIEETDINAWFGPKGTLSPLHTDPKHNLLAQVVGEKRLLLYSPVDSPHLYPHDGSLLNNTAQVDPEEPDYQTYPDFEKAMAWECNLRPGEMLYIPPKWWHHVRSLSTSFSVSFWWT